MLKLIRENADFYLVFIPIFIVGSFAVSLAPIAIGFIGIIWFIVKKRYDYLIVLFFLTLILANNKAPNFSGYESLRIVFVLVLFVLSGIIIFRQKGMDRRINYFLPFFVIALISSFFFSPNAVNSITKVISYLIVVTSIFVLIKYLLQEEQYKLYEQFLLLIGITCFISLVGGVLYPSVFLLAGRLNGVLGNPNFLGLFCIFAYPLIDHFDAEESSFTGRDILLIKALIVLCIFLTGSRSAYVSFALYIMGTIFLYRGVSGKTIAICLGLGALIALTKIELIVKFIPFLNDLVRPETIADASGRSIVWPVAIAEIYRQPWLGGGFEYYAYYMATFARTHGLKGVFWYGVWNTYLAFLLDTGLIGLTAYFYFIFGVIKRSARFLIFLPFLATAMFTGMFEAWAVSSLNPITPFFLLFFVVISVHGSRYENLSLT